MRHAKFRVFAVVTALAIVAVPGPSRPLPAVQRTAVTQQPLPTSLNSVPKLVYKRRRVAASAGVPLGLRRARLRRVDAQGIPPIAFRAYRSAAARAARLAPGCGLTWPVLAGVGQVESDHGRIRPGSRFTANGTLVPTLVGPALTGRGGTKAIGDTDGGALDGDDRWDHAVGPMQFIPSSWRIYGADGNGDGVRDVNNIFDASFAAGQYLCADGGDLTSPPQLAAALFSYNHSRGYVYVVLRVIAAYANLDPDALVSAAGPLAQPPPPRPARRPGRAKSSRPRRRVARPSSRSERPSRSTQRPAWEPEPDCPPSGGSQPDPSSPGLLPLPIGPGGSRPDSCPS